MRQTLNMEDLLNIKVQINKNNQTINDCRDIIEKPNKNKHHDDMIDSMSYALKRRERNK